MTSRRFPDLVAFEQTVSAMLADPEVTGDLLLVGLCMARRIHFGEWRDGKASIADMAQSIFGTGDDVVIVGMGRRTVSNSVAVRWRNAMRNDIRRYDHERDPANGGDPVHIGYRTPCSAPMIRRDGRCGKNATMFGLTTDLESGRLVGIGACTRHEEWWADEIADNDIAVEALGDRLPVPPANTGGALRRHLPAFNWPKYWRTLDPKWVEPPEVEPFVPPTLTLALCDDFEPVDMPRPTLTLIEGDSDA